MYINKSKQTNKKDVIINIVLTVNLSSFIAY